MADGCGCGRLLRGGACFRSVAALFTRLDFENTHTHHYQRCLRTTNSTTFSAILLFQTLNGALSLFLVFEDPVLTLPPWNQMRMRLLEPLGYGRLLKYPLYLHQQRASWRCLSLPTIREQCCHLRIKERLRNINLSDYLNLRPNSERR